MTQYHKINTIYKRDISTHHIVMGAWSTPEFAYLCDNIWEFTEKIDGTNIRVIWSNGELTFKGKTDRADIPWHLTEKLNELFLPKTDIMAAIFDDTADICLYGEGFGNKIQKGNAYIADGVDFALFDVKVGNWWLSRLDVEDIAQKLDILAVPLLGHGTLYEAVEIVRAGFPSKFGSAQAEGIVARPKVQLFARNRKRIIAKIKHCDFKEEQ